jgi:hypothetical protein
MSYIVICYLLILNTINIKKTGSSRTHTHTHTHTHLYYICLLYHMHIPTADPLIVCEEIAKDPDDN